MKLCHVPLAQIQLELESLVDISKHRNERPNKETDDGRRNPLQNCVARKNNGQND